VTAYNNKCSRDWTLFWFYHKVPLDEATQSHPLITKKIRNLGNNPSVDVNEKLEYESFVDMLQEITKL